MKPWFAAALRENIRKTGRGDHDAGRGGHAVAHGVGAPAPAVDGQAFGVGKTLEAEAVHPSERKRRPSRPGPFCLFSSPQDS